MVWGPIVLSLFVCFKMCIRDRFSLNRMYAGAVLPDGSDYTFWGKGVSQGHSDAIRRVEGVKDGIQYTCLLYTSRCV